MPEPRVLGAGVLGDGHGPLGHGVLGQLAGQQAHRSLISREMIVDLTRQLNSKYIHNQDSPLVVVGQLVREAARAGSRRRRPVRSPLVCKVQSQGGTGVVSEGSSS